MMRWILSVLLCLLALPAMAETFTLTYRDQNKWVAPADKQPLRDLLSTAKSASATTFTTTLPATDRELAIERLIILRDILADSLGPGIVISEISGTAPSNTVVVGVE